MMTNEELRAENDRLQSAINVAVWQLEEGRVEAVLRPRQKH